MVVVIVIHAMIGDNQFTKSNRNESSSGDIKSDNDDKNGTNKNLCATDNTIASRIPAARPEGSQFAAQGVTSL